MTSAGDRAIDTAARDGVDPEVGRAASQLEHADEFPSSLAEQRREVGLFGLTVSAQEDAVDAIGLRGGNGYSPEVRPERSYRDAPLLLIGEGSNEIQQLVIARRLLERLPHPA